MIGGFGSKIVLVSNEAYIQYFTLCYSFKKNATVLSFKVHQETFGTLIFFYKQAPYKQLALEASKRQATFRAILMESSNVSKL